MKKIKLLTVTFLTTFSVVASAGYPTQQERDNFAKTMAQKYLDIAIISADARVNKNMYCETGTYTTEITSATLKAIEMARSIYDNKAFARNILTTIKNNRSLQEIIGTQISYRYALATPTLGYSLETFKSALIGSIMYGPAPGALGNLSEISFKNSSTASLRSVDMDNEGNVTYSTKIVRYSVTQNSDYESIVTIEGKDYRAVQSADGFLLVPAESKDDTDAYRNGFAEYASECEA